MQRIECKRVPAVHAVTHTHTYIGETKRKTCKRLDTITYMWCRYCVVRPGVQGYEEHTQSRAHRSRTPPPPPSASPHSDVNWYRGDGVIYAISERRVSTHSGFGNGASVDTRAQDTCCFPVRVVDSSYLYIIVCSKLFKPSRGTWNLI